jgi:predicted permease
LFAPEEDGPGAPKVAILSDGLKERRWGAGESAIGSTILLDGEPFAVIGVLTPDMRFAVEGVDAPDLWVPVGSTSLPLSEGNHFLEGLGRLREGVALEAARQETELLLRRDRSAEVLGARLVPLYEAVVGEVRPPLLLLMGASGFLLLMAGASVAALLVGEAGRREREVATRVALGAAGGRIVRQFLTETLLLSSLAVGVGVAVAYGLTAGLLALAPPELPRLEEVVVDGRVLAFAAGLGVSIGLAFGLARTAALLRVPSLVLLQSGGRHSVRGGGRGQTFLLGAQLMIAMLLLAGATLLGRSLLHVEALEPGFRAEGLLTALIELPEERYSEAFQVTQFYTRLQERLEAEPEIVAVGGISTAPFTGRVETTSVRLDDLPEDAPSLEAERRVILPGTLETLGVPLLSGSLGEGSGELPTVLVSATLARRLWPDRPALGAGLSLRSRSYTVVGVVGDVRDQDVREASEGAYYVPHAVARDGPPRRMHVLLRTAGSPARAATLLRQVISELDAGLPLSDLSTMDALIRRSLAWERYRTLLVNAFAGIALVLVAVGIFGVTLRLALRRRRELAVRSALGATPRELVTYALAPTLPWAAVGTAVGLVLGLTGAPLLGRFLDGVAPRDLLTHGSSAILLLAVAFVAAWLPARRVAHGNLVAALADD